jgi:DNA gyrase/topoisomerase IV subunit B
LFEIVGNSLDQHLAGHATRVSIDINRSGTVTVEDDGDGIPVALVAEHRRSFVELVFTKLHFTPTMDGHSPHVHARAGLHGVGVSVVSALSSRLEVETRGGNFGSKIAFAQGKTVEPLTELGPTTKRGTWIRYSPDPAIFEGARHDLRAIKRRLVQLAGLTPKLDIRFQGKSLQRPEGLAGWLRELAPHAMKETALVASGTHEGVIVEAAFAWNPRARRKTPKVLSFVNCSETRLNGSHVKGLLAAVRATPPTTIDQDRVMKGLVALVHVQMSGPQFAGPTKWQLDAEPARIAVQEVVTRALKASPWWWDKLHEALG